LNTIYAAFLDTAKPVYGTSCRQCRTSLDHLDFLSESGKVAYIFRKKIAEKAFIVDQGH